MLSLGIELYTQGYSDSRDLHTTSVTSTFMNNEQLTCLHECFISIPRPLRRGMYHHTNQTRFDYPNPSLVYNECNRKRK